MKKQFLHEQSNRNDRAKKGDYRDDLCEVTDRKHTPDAISKTKETWDEKRRLIERYKTGGYAFAGGFFRFGCTAEEFAQRNAPGIGRLYKTIAHEAKLELEFIIDAIQRGKVFEDIETGELRISTSVKTACVPNFKRD